jgi:hypothetical protein
MLPPEARPVVWCGRIYSLTAFSLLAPAILGHLFLLSKTSKDQSKMFTAASRLTSIASRNNATSITRRWVCKKADSCSCIEELSPHLIVIEDARLGYNAAQRLLRKVKKQDYSTENMDIICKAFRREKYKHERDVLKKVAEKVGHKSNITK